MKRIIAAALLLAALLSSCITISYPDVTKPGDTSLPVSSETLPDLTLSETVPSEAAYPHVDENGIADPLIKRAAKRIDPAVNAAIDVLNTFRDLRTAEACDLDPEDIVRDYDSLNEISKDVYRELYDAVSHFRTYSIVESELDSANPFGDIVDAVYAIFHDYPVTKAYWMDGGDYYSHRPRYFLPNDEKNPTEELEAVADSVRFYEAVFQRILDCMPGGLSNTRKCLYLAAVVCSACTYDESRETREGPFYAYDALVRGTAVCSGYTQAFELLCYAAGVNCSSLTGKVVGSDEQHIWNRVETDQGYRYIDVTWTDNGIEEYGLPFFSAYFMIDEEMMLNSGYIPDP